MPRGRYAEPAPSYFSWSGFYVGLNGGYGWGTSDWSSGVTAGSTDPAGGLFGGTIGFNVQNWGLVFGLEGDLAGNWMRNNTSSGTGICAVPGCQIQTSWFGTARGRVGYAFDRALFYVTAGGAFGDVQMSAGAGPRRSSGRVGPPVWVLNMGYSVPGPRRLNIFMPTSAMRRAVPPTVASTLTSASRPA